MADATDKLRRCLREGSWTYLSFAYLYATLLVAGPWLAAILTVLFLPFLLGFDWQKGDPELLTFLTSFSWITALSLIFGGAGGLVYARLTSDLLRLERPERVVPNLHGLWLRLLALVQPLWLFYLWLFSDFPWYYLLELLLALGLQLGVVLFLVLMATAQLFQTTLMLYGAAFGLFSLLVWLRDPKAAETLLGLWICSQTTLLLGLVIVTWHRYPFERLFHNDFEEKVYRDLLWIGFGLHLALWLDKFLFWWSPAGAPLHGALRYSVLYDGPASMAFALIIPFLGLTFLLHEGRFLAPFTRYYQLVRQKTSLYELWLAQQELVLTFKQNFRMLLVGQVLFLVLFLSIGRHLLSIFNFPLAFQLLLQNLLPGVVMVADLTFFLLVLLYFDEHRQVGRITKLLVLLMGGTTWWVAHKCPPYLYGVNVMLAAAVPLGMALLSLNRLLTHLSYYTFMEKNCPYSAVRYHTLNLEHD